MRQGFDDAGGIAVTERASGLWMTAGYFVAFFTLLIGLQHLQIAGLGGAAVPLTAVIIIVAILALIAVLLRREGASFGSIGLTARKVLPQFSVGLAVGLAVCALMIGSLLLLTPLAIRPATSGNTLPALSFAFFVIFLLGLMEEIVFRSYPLFKLDDAVGTRTAVYVTSVAFAFYHGLDVSNVLGPGVWGLFYGWMALKTNSIALPTGFHVGLNYMQALFGMKPKYGGAIWELEIGQRAGVLETETLGFALQVVLLIIGIVLVERLIRQRDSEMRTGKEASEP